MCGLSSSQKLRLDQIMSTVVSSVQLRPLSQQQTNICCLCWMIDRWMDQSGLSDCLPVSLLVLLVLLVLLGAAVVTLCWTGATFTFRLFLLSDWNHSDWSSDQLFTCDLIWCLHDPLHLTWTAVSQTCVMSRSDVNIRWGKDGDLSSVWSWSCDRFDFIKATVL